MKLLLLLILSCSLYATNLEKTADGKYYFKNKSFSALKLVEKYAEEKGYSLILDVKVSDKKTTLNINNGFFTEDEIEDLIHIALFETGWAMIKSSNTKLIKIIPQRNLRFENIEVKTDLSKIKKSDEFHKYTFRLKHADSKDVSRSFRPFLSRYGRIVNNRGNNAIILYDTGNNIHRLMNLLEVIDSPDAAKAIKESKKLQEKFAKKTSTAFDLNRDLVLYIVIFSLLGLIIGFLFRGFVIRRIEGGL